MDLTLEPNETVTKPFARDPQGHTVRIYESGAVPGALSVVMASEFGYVAGTRITLTQAIALNEALEEFIEKEMNQ